VARGTIIKGVGGFYTVLTADGEQDVLRARGNFRLHGLTPLIGDEVEYDPAQGMMLTILPRKNEIARPPVANATLGVIVASLKSPDLSYLMLDKMLLQSRAAGLSVGICFNKADLAQQSQIREVKAIYAQSGALASFTCAKTGEGLDEVALWLHGNVTIFSGVSGAGKSKIIRYFCPNREDIASGDLSQKLGRGKNTTRHSEIYVTETGDFIIDTPGYSSLALNLSVSDVWKHYPEFYEYSDCRFDNCLHLAEPGCHVKEAVSNGLIPKERYDNYVAIIEELRS